MNNFVWGNDRLQNYETICGGTGAGPDFSGTSAVHSHMTNTRMTDPEVLEKRFPVRVDEFAIRRGSGGSGAQSGGDGIVRRMRFLEAMTVTTLTSHRDTHPFGMQGGEDGACGENQRAAERRTGADTGGQRSHRCAARRCVLHEDAGRRRLGCRLTAMGFEMRRFTFHCG